MGTRMGIARTGKCFVNKTQMMPNEEKECNCIVHTFVQMDNVKNPKLCVLCRQPGCLGVVLMLTLNRDNGDSCHRLSGVTRDN